MRIFEEAKKTFIQFVFYSLSTPNLFEFETVSSAAIEKAIKYRNDLVPQNFHAESEVFKSKGH